MDVNDVFQSFGFNKRIRYIGSQIRSEEAMAAIHKSIPNFSLSLTVECFSNRKAKMHSAKGDLDMESIRAILARSLEYGFSTNYLYIVGLDEMQIMDDGVQSLSSCINRMPIFQIMQNYIAEHESQRVEDAKNIRFYLEARKRIESIFSNNSFKPRSWENYRGLFYTEYQGSPLRCIRI